MVTSARNRGSGVLFTFCFFVYHLIQCLGYWLVLFYIFLVMPYTIKHSVDVGGDLVSPDPDEAGAVVASHHAPAPAPVPHVNRFVRFLQYIRTGILKWLHFFKGNIPFTIFFLGLMIGMVFAAYNCRRYAKEQEQAIKLGKTVQNLSDRYMKLERKRKVIIQVLDLNQTAKKKFLQLKKDLKKTSKDARVWVRKCLEHLKNKQFTKKPDKISKWEEICAFFQRYFLSSVTHFFLGAGAGAGIMWTMISLFDIAVTQFIFMAILMVTAGVGMLYLGLSIYIEGSKSVLKHDREEEKNFIQSNALMRASLLIVQSSCAQEVQLQKQKQKQEQDEEIMEKAIKIKKILDEFLTSTEHNEP